MYPDVEKPGTYTVKYSCTNAKGVSARAASRQVISVAAPLSHHLTSNQNHKSRERHQTQQPGICDAAQLAKCKPLVLRGAACVDCIKNLPAKCSAKQMDVMCWMVIQGEKGDAGMQSENIDDSFDRAVELSKGSRGSSVAGKYISCGLPSAWCRLCTCNIIIKSISIAII
jgi:hypothetical protein